MGRVICPICEKQCSDIIKHFAIVHEIEGMEQLNIEIINAKNRDERCRKFREYVEDLQEKIKTGEITSKDYRELITQWCEKHSENGENHENCN